MRWQDVIGWSEETPSPVVDDDGDKKTRDVKAGSGLVFFGLVGIRKKEPRVRVCLFVFI